MNENRPTIADRENLELIVQQCIKRLARANQSITGVFVTINLKSDQIAHKGEFSTVAHCETTLDVNLFHNLLFVLKPGKR